jgi:hypothetical protein
VSSLGSCAEVDAIVLGSWAEGGAGGWVAPAVSSVSCLALGRAGCPEAPALIGGIALVSFVTRGLLVKLFTQVVTAMVLASMLSIVQSVRLVLLVASRSTASEVGGRSGTVART